jgi:hypothetical protein
MHVCGVCGTLFEPGDYQVVADGRSYHSVDCAVRARDHGAAARPARGESVERHEIPGAGRAYSVVASLGRSGDDRTARSPEPAARP